MASQLLPLFLSFSSPSPRLPASVHRRNGALSRSSLAFRHRQCSSILVVPLVGKEDTELRVSSEQDEDVDPTPEDLEYIDQIKRVLELLRKNRDMLFGEVNEGKIPKDKAALKMLAEELNSWPYLEVEAPKTKPRKSLYAKATDTGIDPKEAAKRLNIDWDSAAEIEETATGTDDSEVPPAV